MAKTSFDLPMRSPSPPPLAAPLLTLLLASCGSEAEGSGSEEPASATGSTAEAAPVASTEVANDIRDLVTAVTPLSPTATPGQRSGWFGRRDEVLERLRAASHAHGLEALRVYGEKRDAVDKIRMGLLDVAAHAAPEETLPVLVELVTVYGDDLAVRTKAAEVLPAASPDVTIEILEPILRHQKPGRTYPAEEILVRTWNRAMLSKGRDAERVDLLCLVATDLSRPMDVRHLSIKLLGDIESAQGRQALEQLLVESSGNHMLRRFAAQSLRDSVPADEICPVLTRVRDNEADPNFQIFLDDLVQRLCP